MQQHRSRSVLGLLIGTVLSAHLPAQGEARLARPTGGFVVNQGQWTAAARYQSRGQGATVWCLDDGWTLALPIPSPSPEVGDGTGVAVPGRDRWVVRLVVEGARPSRVEGGDLLPTKTSFCRGVQSEGRRDVPSFERVRWESMLPGVDVEASWRDGRFTYDLHVDPGADPAAVVIRCEGISELRLRADGCLEMQTPHGVVVQSAPKSWNVRADGVRSQVQSVFRLLDGHRYGFVLQDHDTTRPLVIDPGIEWSSLLGGSGGDVLTSVVRDGQGGFLCAGMSDSTDLPFRTGPNKGLGDAMLARIVPDARGRLWCPWVLLLGGAMDDWAFDLAADANGSLVHVVGYTQSSNFPVTSSAYQATSGGGMDGFFATVNSYTGALVYSTYIGSTGDEWIAEIEPGVSGEMVVAGYTASLSFPVPTGGYQPTHAGGTGRDFFILRLHPGQAQFIVGGTFLGGTLNEGILSIPSDAMVAGLHVSKTGVVTVAGMTRSPNFPVTPTSAVSPWIANSDMFVSRLDSKLTTLIYSTCLGGTQNEGVLAIAVDEDGVISLGGYTWSSNFPATPNSFKFGAPFGGMNDAVLARIDPRIPGPGGLLYSCHFGGPGWDPIWDVDVEWPGVIVACGLSQTAGLATSGASQTQFLGSAMAMVLRLDPRGNGQQDMHYLTYLGGGAASAAGEAAFDLLADGLGGATIVGYSDALSFPVRNGFQALPAGGIADTFIARLDLLPVRTGRIGTGNTPSCLGNVYAQVSSDPSPGNAAFSLLCVQAPPQATGVLVLGLESLTPMPILNETLHVLPIGLECPLVSSSKGGASVPLLIPASSAGMQAAAQFFWINPPSCPGNGPLSASQGLRIRP